MKTEPGICVECGGSLVPIRIVEQDHRSHLPLKYAAMDSTRSVVLGRYPLLGEISAELCTDCGRVTLRAKPF
jgi:hypothetical protein